MLVPTSAFKDCPFVVESWKTSDGTTAKDRCGSPHCLPMEAGSSLDRGQAVRCKCKCK